MEKQKKKIVIFGIGDIAKLAHYYFVHDSDFEVVAFTADPEFIECQEYLGLPVVPFNAVSKQYPPDQYAMFIAISYQKINKVRAEKYDAAKTLGYSLVSYISSKATILNDYDIGDNCFILEDNTIQPFVKIGNNVTLWSGNHIGHDAVIKDHCFIASHVVVSGFVVIEPYCFLGVNATLRNNITIAQGCVIGAGALILKDTDEFGVYVTSPATLHQLRSDQLKRL